MTTTSTTDVNNFMNMKYEYDKRMKMYESDMLKKKLNT